jgi:Holliday junction resolvase RusA-like endonuclease
MPFQMFVYVYPPDKRKRDLDNILKVMQDAICDGLSVDDSHIVAICAIRCEIFRGGKVEIVFTECNADEWIETHGICQHDRLATFVSLSQDR